ncbi:MAG: B12-binding domain-containing radical SAM protein [Armatimonadetes bacterium]|nr:B12-binding domain-containing radical SAM protein [Armatimonadota bacterium]
MKSFHGKVFFVNFLSFFSHNPLQSRRTEGHGKLWLDLGDPGVFRRSGGPQDRWQDHGMGLLRTILKKEGVETDMFSLRSLRSWDQLPKKLAGYDQLVMNVRSYTFPFAYKAACTFKEVNPRGLVLVGGMHATVSPDEMEASEVFDRICQGGGEKDITGLLKDPLAYPRVFAGQGARSMEDWPMLDRTLWPDPRRRDFPWPLEPPCGWGPAPVATVVTSRVCPWKCVFCNESSYIPNMKRKSVDQVIEELNYLDDAHGPIGSVVIHDSMFFQQPRWLEEWLDKYPRKTHKPWPYWAAGRSDTVRQWPGLFEALVRETNWNTISLGFESGSDRVLKILNKECTVEDNCFAIDLLNRIGDDLERQGAEPPRFWANVMLGIPGETREDAFDTMRMVHRMKRVFKSIAYYAPYPGSALGYQLIAEGKSLMSRENYHRYPSDEKVKGVDYKFYNELLAGKHDHEIHRGLVASEKA